MFIARLMRPEDVPGVNALRVAGYASASWFQMRDAHRVHVASDYPNTRVLVMSPARAPREVVATMAATMNYELSEVEDTLGANLLHLPVELPGMSLVRLSVDAQYRGLALNHVLRKICLDAGQELSEHGLVLAQFGSQAAGTPNIPAMRAMGYQYYSVQPQRLNHVTLDPNGMLAYVLPAARFGAVRVSVQAEVERKGVSYSWEGPTLAEAVAEAVH